MVGENIIWRKNKSAPWQNDFFRMLICSNMNSSFFEKKNWIESNFNNEMKNKLETVTNTNEYCIVFNLITILIISLNEK